MMKYFIYAIAVIHLGCSTSLGEETGFDRQLPAPDSIHIRGQMGEKSKKLKKYLFFVVNTFIKNRYFFIYLSVWYSQSKIPVI